MARPITLEVRNASGHSIQLIRGIETPMRAYNQARQIMKQTDYNVLLTASYRPRFNFRNTTSFTDVSDWYYHGL